MFFFPREDRLKKRPETLCPYGFRRIPVFSSFPVGERHLRFPWQVKAQRKKMFKMSAKCCLRTVLKDFPFFPLTLSPGGFLISAGFFPFF